MDFSFYQILIGKWVVKVTVAIVSRVHFITPITIVASLCNQKCLFSKIQPILSVARINVQMLSTEKLQENDGQECAKHSFQGFFTKKASRSRNTSSLSDVERVKCRKVTLRTSFIIKSEVIRQF